MNNVTDSSGFIGSGFWYGIGVSIGILILITTITLASYFCTRSQLPVTAPSAHRIMNATVEPQHRPVVDVEGIDEATILSYPKLLFSEALANLKGSDSDHHQESNNINIPTCCSICLTDYKDRDMVRVLPDCGHLFHLTCIDPWLRMHPTCPLCRTSPIPTPLSTPLAQVVPLATATPS